MYIFLHIVVPMICNICLLFALLFVCLHVDDNVTICLLLYIHRGRKKIVPENEFPVPFGVVKI